MSRPEVTRAAGLRALFNETPGEELTMRDVYVRGEVTGKGEVRVRNAIRDAVSALVDCGFLVKTGRGKAATFRCSGNGMVSDRRPAAMSRDVRLALRRERERVGRSASHPAVRQRHARLLDAPTGCVVHDAETVEQFRARGGRVERLPTHWEQMERAA